MGRVTGIDKAARRVDLDCGAVTYDYLVVATGARHAYFGRDDWEKTAPGLKKIDDATDIRRRILTAFERAETDGHGQAPGAADLRGGRRGPTGVEMAGAIAELRRFALAEDFRNIDPTQARVLLIEAGPRLLPAFPEDLSVFTRNSLIGMGVDVKTGQPVSECDACA